MGFQITTMALSAVCGYKPPTSSLVSNFSEDNQENCGNFSANSTLALPPFSHPATNLGRILTDDQGKDIDMNFDHGTTTLGFKYQGGVILAVDSRATVACTLGLALSRRSLRSTSSCWEPWLVVLLTVPTGKGCCPSSAGFTSSATGRESVLLLPVSCCPTWRTTTRAWGCLWV